MKRMIAILLTLTLLSLSASALAAVDLSDVESSELFVIDETEDGSGAFVSIALSDEYMPFTHRYSLEDHPSVAYSDLYIGNYKTDAAYAVWRLWIEYCAAQNLNITSMTLTFNGTAYTFTDLSGTRNNEVFEDHVWETPCIIFGADNMDFWVDFMVYCEDLGDVTALTALEIPLVLHGDEDVETVLSGWTVVSIFLIGEEMMTVSGIEGIFAMSGTPVQTEALNAATAEAVEATAEAVEATAEAN